MKPVSYPLIAGLCALTLSACQPQADITPQSQAAPSGKVLTTVNNIAITEPMIEAYARQRSVPEGRTTELKDKLTQELVNVTLLSQQAISDGLDKDPTTRTELHMQTQMLLAGKAVNAYLEKNPVGDGELQRKYDEQIKESGADQEYKARHVLVDTEELAKEIIKQLNGGGDFAALAKKHSTGPSNAKGGDLGWFSPERMVPAFSKAAAALKKGEYTKAPVQTRFGWHVILLEDLRDLQPPPFETVKERIRSVVKQEMVQAYIQSLVEKATITVAE